MNTAMTRWAIPAIVFAVVISAYYLTAPRTITLEDAGLFQMVCHQGGLSHPPGYPLFTFACQALTFEPTTLNGNLISALFGALAAVALYFVALGLLGNVALAATAAMTYAFSANFWAQATIIEVYTQAAMMFFICWLSFARYVESLDLRWWYLSCFLSGLALCTHLPLIVLAAPALLAICWPARDEIIRNLRRPAFIAGSIAAGFLGLLPYLSLFQSDPVAAVFGGINSPGEFVSYITREHYSDQQLGAGMEDKLSFLAWLPLETMRQLGFVLSLLAAAGLVFSIRRYPPFIWIALLLNFLMPTVVLLLMLGFVFDRHGQSIFMPYPTIGYASLAIWVVMGIAGFASVINKHVSLVTGLLGALTVALTLYVNAAYANRSQDHWVEDYFLTVLQSLEEDSILFTAGDLVTHPVGHLHQVEGHVASIDVYDWDGLVFNNRLVDVFESRSKKDAFLIDYIQKANRPVYLIQRRIEPVTDYGLFFQFNSRGNEIVFLDEAEIFLDGMLDLYESGNIVRQQELELADFILARYMRQYGNFLSTGGALSEAQQTRFSRLQATFPGKMMMLEQLVVRAETAEARAALAPLVQAALEQRPPQLERKHEARLYRHAARVFQEIDPALADAYLDLSRRYGAEDL